MDILIEEQEGSLWVAALQNGRLEGLEVDPAHEEVRWGSIYWAKVTSINKALDAAFLDLDGYNTGILYNRDTRWKKEDGSIEKGGRESIAKHLKAGDMVPVQAKSAYIMNEDDDFLSAENKTLQMSMDITLPGRHLIFANSLTKNKISQRIRDKKLRQQLDSMINEIEDIQSCILRSSAANTQSDVLIREGKILKTAWEEISNYFEGSEPSLIALGPDAMQRTLSDQADQQIDRIEVVTMDHFNTVEEWASIFAPDLVTKITPLELDNAEEDLALFHYRDIIGQIEALFQSYVLMPSGGSLIIQNTSALTAIDINKGSSKSSNLNLNIEAAKEITRQMRLRNSGGIVIADLLKMPNKKDQNRFLKALEDEVNKDPCTVQIHGISGLGLLEITRKRRTPPLEERFDGILS
ncbi:MAG: ribonuclease E [Micavibrio sp. TMED27]|nr:ribonuclease E [Micavibrio sp.]OUT92267.1 MAG: ribonuclease E [Micavibrio sp. TMED27]